MDAVTPILQMRGARLQEARGEGRTEPAGAGPMSAPGSRSSTVFCQLPLKKKIIEHFENRELEVGKRGANLSSDTISANICPVSSSLCRVL